MIDIRQPRPPEEFSWRMIVDEKTWLSCTDPMKMLKWIETEMDSPSDIRITDKKLRQWCVACRNKAYPMSSKELVDDPNDITTEQFVNSWAMCRSTPEHDTSLKTCPMALRAHYLRELVNPFYPKFVKPKELPLLWLHDSDVKHLAESIYRDKAFQELPILADALEEAGCNEQEILIHLRGKPCPFCKDAYHATPGTKSFNSIGHSLKSSLRYEHTQKDAQEFCSKCVCKGTRKEQWFIPCLKCKGTGGKDRMNYSNICPACKGNRGEYLPIEHLSGCWVLSLLRGEE